LQPTEFADVFETDYRRKRPNQQNSLFFSLLAGNSARQSNRENLNGAVGAIVGGYLFTLVGSHGVTGLNLWSLLVAVIGSIVVLVIYHAVVGRGRAAC